jgi:predicted nucleotidyltransferase component of viral defense system
VIHQNPIKRRADKDGLSAPAVERDYVLAHALAAISEHDRQAQLVFKGGTALRLCHLDDYRYSADLDFSLFGGLDVESALRIVADALADCTERIGFPLLGLTGSTPPRVEYVGPLGAKPRSLKLDLATDELVEYTATLPIARRYEDQEEGQCRVYTLEEIAAEKLRCVMQRLQCRDLYDLHELLVGCGVDAEAIWPLFERKARHRDCDPDRFGDYFADRGPRWGERWDRELAEYVASPPHFDGVLRAVRRELRFALVS